MKYEIFLEFFFQFVCLLFCFCLFVCFPEIQDSLSEKKAHLQKKKYVIEKPRLFYPNNEH